MECWKVKECPKELRENCPAFQTGNTTNLRCRRLAPLDRIFQGSTFDCRGRLVGDPVLMCFNCPVYLFHRSATGRTAPRQGMTREREQEFRQSP